MRAGDVPQRFARLYGMGRTRIAVGFGFASVFGHDRLPDHRYSIGYRLNRCDSGGYFGGALVLVSGLHIAFQQYRLPFHLRLKVVAAQFGVAGQSLFNARSKREVGQALIE